MKQNMGKKIALLRKMNHYTQEDLAESLGVTRQTISRWESETSYPDIDYLNKIATLFKVDLSYFDEKNFNETNKDDHPLVKTINRLKIFLLVLSIGCVCMFVTFNSKIRDLNAQIQYITFQNSNVVCDDNNENISYENYSKVDFSFDQYDYLNAKVHIHINLTLKEFYKDTTVIIMIEAGSDVFEETQKVENGILTFDIEIPLIDNYSISSTISNETYNKVEFLKEIKNTLSDTKVDMVAGSYSVKSNLIYLYEMAVENNEFSGTLVEYIENNTFKVPYETQIHITNNEFVKAEVIKINYYVDDVLVASSHTINNNQQDDQQNDITFEGEIVNVTLYDKANFKIKAEIQDSLNRVYEETVVEQQTEVDMINTDYINLNFNEIKIK